MDAYQAFEIILNCVRNSNLNFLVTESPFSASITIKKSFIKEKNGSTRASNFTAIPRGDTLVIEENKILKKEVHSLKDTIIQHKYEINHLKSTVIDLEKNC